MRRPDLEEKILDYIKTLYKAEYKGLLEVNQDENAYVFRIGLPSYMATTRIMGDFSSDDDFLNNIYEELRTRNYMRLDIYRIVRQHEEKT